MAPSPANDKLIKGRRPRRNRKSREAHSSALTGQGDPRRGEVAQHQGHYRVAVVPPVLAVGLDEGAVGRPGDDPDHRQGHGQGEAAEHRGHGHGPGERGVLHAEDPLEVALPGDAPEDGEEHRVDPLAKVRGAHLAQPVPGEEALLEGDRLVQHGVGRGDGEAHRDADQLEGVGPDRRVEAAGHQVPEIFKSAPAR